LLKRTRRRHGKVAEVGRFSERHAGRKQASYRQALARAAANKKMSKRGKGDLTEKSKTVNHLYHTFYRAISNQHRFTVPQA
jgi:hypothetical protein